MHTSSNHNHTEPFWDRIAPKYAKKPISDLASYEEKISRVRSLLHPQDRVLEIGCGTGGTALRLASGVSGVVATDISKRMIEIARSKISPEQSSNISFQQARASDLVENDPFDAICAFSLLHLVDDIQTVLRVAHQQLKPGGLFISKTVCLRDGSYAVRLFVRALTAVGIAPRVASFSRSDLVRQLKFAGFEIETVTHFGNQRTNPFIVARRPYS